MNKVIYFTTLVTVALTTKESKELVDYSFLGKLNKTKVKEELEHYHLDKEDLKITVISVEHSKQEVEIANDSLYELLDKEESENGELKFINV